MINYYQPYLLPFLGFQKSTISKGIKRYYYHSFEDGLWDLLEKRSIPKRSVVLIPDFYCTDVLLNIKLHGYSYQLYPLDKNFQVNQKTIQKYIKKYNPKMLILFHACGITSMLIKNKKWLTTIAQDMIILEDCVHLVVKPNKVHIIHDNHYLIDSLRKVSPLCGSFLYGTHNGMCFEQKNHTSVSTYQMKSFFWFFIFRSLFILGNMTNNAHLVRFSHQVLKKHDDVIGDSPNAHRGFFLFSLFFDWFHFKKIEMLKTKQVNHYQIQLKPLFLKNSLFYPIRIPQDDYRKLHVYPLGFQRRPDHRLIQHLHNHDCIVWYKFEDSPWSRSRGVLFLPLGFHMDKNSIIKLSQTLISYQSVAA